MSVSFRTPKPLHTAEWEWHKERINYLYMLEDKPLSEVVEIMRNEHGLRAMPKMYKTQFKRWGFRKNLKAHESRIIEASVVAGKEIDLPIAHGRTLGSKRLKVRAAQTKRQSSVSIRSSFPRSVDAPDSLYLTDISLRAVATYMQLRCDYWDMARYPEKVSEAGNWQVKMHLAAWRISGNQDMGLNFRILSNACDDFKRVLQIQEPLLVWAIYDAVLQLLQVDVNLAKPFIKLAFGYCSLYFGRNHPLTALLNSISRMEVSNIRESARALIDVQFDLFRSTASGNNLFPPIFVSSTAKKMHDLLILSPHETLARIDASIGWMRQIGSNSGIDIIDFKSKLMEIYLLKATIHGDAQQWNETSSAIDDAEHVMAGLDDEAMSDPIIRTKQVGCLELRSALLEHTGNSEGAELHQEQALCVAREFLIKDPNRLGFVYATTERLYLRLGNTEKAQAVKLESENLLRSLAGESVNST